MNYQYLFCIPVLFVCLFFHNETNKGSFFEKMSDKISPTYLFVVFSPIHESGLFVSDTLLLDILKTLFNKSKHSQAQNFLFFIDIVKENLLLTQHFLHLHHTQPYICKLHISSVFSELLSQILHTLKNKRYCQQKA